MDAIEKAIRGAFEKGDASEKTFRAKVYRSAFAALERTIEGHSEISPEQAAARRNALKEKITEIEIGFQSMHETPSVTEPQESQMDVTPETRVAPDDKPGKAPTGGRRRRPFALMFLLVTVLAFLGLGLWWTIDSGILMSSTERDGSVRNPPRILESEDYSAPANGAASSQIDRAATGEWISVFSPQDPTTVAAPAAASANIVSEDDVSFLRISAEGDAAVVFDVGRGILESLAGKRALFAIEAQAQEGSETQISISCEFGVLGDCGRTRYVVGSARNEYLFEVEFPQETAQAGGSIAIVPDLEGEGRVLEIFTIRVAQSD